MAEKHPCDVSYKLGGTEYTLRVTWGVMAAIHEIVGPDVATEDILKTHDALRIAKIFCAAASPKITVEEFIAIGDGPDAPPFMEVLAVIDAAMAKGYIGPKLSKATEKADEKNLAARKKNTP